MKYREESSAFTKSCTVPLKIYPATGAESVSYTQKLYKGGHQPSRENLLLAGLLFLRPVFGKLGTMTMPRAWRAPRGWRRRRPARSRCPHSLPIWAGIAVQLWRWSLYGFAIYLTMMVATYTRRSELLSAQRQDLQKPLTTADESVRRYERRARLVASFNKLPHSLQDYLKECERKLPDLFLGKLLVDAQPLPPTRG